MRSIYTHALRKRRLDKQKRNATLMSLPKSVVNAKTPALLLGHRQRCPWRLLSRPLSPSGSRSISIHVSPAFRFERLVFETRGVFSSFATHTPGNGHGPDIGAGGAGLREEIASESFSRLEKREREFPFPSSFRPTWQSRVNRSICSNPSFSIVSSPAAS